MFFFDECHWDTSCRSRRELSNAIVKSDFRLTGVEIWPFPFRPKFRLRIFDKWSYMGNLQGEAGGTREIDPGGTEGGRLLKPAYY